jgi:hypothetical protein
MKTTNWLLPNSTFWNFFEQVPLNNGFLSSFLSGTRSYQRLKGWHYLSMICKSMFVPSPSLSHFCCSSPQFTTFTSLHCELITSCRNQTWSASIFHRHSDSFASIVHFGIARHCRFVAHSIRKHNYVLPSNTSRKDWRRTRHFCSNPCYFWWATFTWRNSELSKRETAEMNNFMTRVHSNSWTAREFKYFMSWSACTHLHAIDFVDLMRCFDHSLRLDVFFDSWCKSKFLQRISLSFISFHFQNECVNHKIIICKISQKLSGAKRWYLFDCDSSSYLLRLHPKRSVHQAPVDCSWQIGPSHHNQSTLFHLALALGSSIGRPLEAYTTNLICYQILHWQLTWRQVRV